MTTPIDGHFRGLTPASFLARRLLAALGASLLLPACVDDLVDIDASSGASDGTEGPSTGGPSTSGSASSVGSSSPDEGSEPEPDCGHWISEVVCVDPSAHDETGSGTTELGSTGLDGDATGSGDEATGSTDGGSTDDATAGSDATGGAVSCEGVFPQYEDWGACVSEVGEVYEQDGLCCRLWEGTSQCCDGRPFLVGDELRTAAIVRRADWQGGERPAIDRLGAAERAALAAAWQADGLMEHASIASFARFVLHLMALGAPSSLVAAAQQAMADEVEHARRCFALAGAYAGHPVGPGPLAIDGALRGPLSLRDAAVAAVLEGCVGETLAAHQASTAAELASDPVVRRVLADIAEDEARHAELAWRFVAWALAQGDAEVRAAVASALAGARPGAPSEDAERPAPIAAAVWRAHGRLSPREQARTLARGYREIIAPCARVLLAGGVGEPPSRLGEALRGHAAAEA